MYKKHVIVVARSIDIANHEEIFRMAGMNGCIGSSDATHVIMLKCSSWATHGSKGFKLNLPARTYNLTVTHSKLILCSTTGHPSTWNDKTLVLFDPLLSAVNDGDMYDDFEFTLFEHDLDGNIVEVKYKGVWFIVDNGYLEWSCTVPPVKDARTYVTIRFSEWLESMRKDVECTFGILKQRFSILRHGVRLESMKLCDKVWLTCCALHNRLLMLDGLDQNWLSDDTYDSYSPTSSQTDIPFAIHRLNRNISADESINDTFVNPQLFDEYTVDGYRIVSKMPLELFRNCLTNHFNIRYKMNSVYWPKRNPNKPTNI